MKDSSCDSSKKMVFDSVKARSIASASIGRQKRRNVVVEDLNQRIPKLKALPKAILLKNLIQQRRMEPEVVNLKEFNMVSQAAATFSGNAINKILEDQIEFGRAQSIRPEEFHTPPRLKEKEQFLNSAKAT